MNKILNKNFHSILYQNPFKFRVHPGLTIIKSYQTESRLKKFRFLKSNVDFKPIVQFTDKNTCLLQLKLTSESLISDLKRLRWFKEIEDSNKKIKILKQSFDLNDVISKHLNSPQMTLLVDYINSNFEQFNTKEKAIIFKIFSLVNHSNLSQVKLHNLLVRLETDYYDQIEKCDLVDFCNYLDGFFFFRDSNSHFYSKSTDTIFKKALNSLDSIPSASECLESSQIVDSINKQWLENLKHENKYVLSLHTLNKLSLLNSEEKVYFFIN